MKSMIHTIKRLIEAPDKGIFIYFDPKTKCVIIECRAIGGGELITNPQAIPIGDLQMSLIDAIDLTAVDVMEKAKRSMYPGLN
jgi:hypothetical protein